MTDGAWQELLASLASQIGVRGAFIFDAEGAAQAASVGEGEAEFDLAASGRAFSRTLAGLVSQRRGKLIDLDLVYHDGRMLLRTFENGFLAILCDRQVNLPLLTMSIEEAVQRLRFTDGALSGGLATRPVVEDDALILMNIAREELGEHASKVIEVLEAARGSRDELAAAIDRAEKITRLFISRQKASEMAKKMRTALFSRKE
jgi:predicted regulator of Ras-like GTPase activity (Roadblock/LC7/MglB family)